MKSLAHQVFTVIKYCRVRTPIPLGRWNLSYNNKVTEIKVLHANEDHCGTCSEEDSKPKNLGKGNVDGSNINKGILDQWYKIEYEVLTKSLPDDRIK
jgi:hypothetical protein